MSRYFSEEKVQMACKYMQKCSASLAIRAMQIETTPRFHPPPVRITIIKDSENNEGR